MPIDDIYQKLAEKSIHRSHFFGRSLHAVLAEDFAAVKAYFAPSYNLLNNKQNFRTKNPFRHIHAIQIDEVIEFHYDYGNPDKGVLFVIFHVVLDVVPYYLYFLLRLQWPYARQRKWQKESQV